MKKSLIALAVAATTLAPIAAQAEAKVYGSLRPQIVSNGEVEVTDGGSRYGIKGSNDLGNGLSAVYRLEKKVDTSSANFPEAGRLGWVGLQGSFGTVAIGQQYTPYNLNVTDSSDSFASGGLVFSPTPFRKGNALTYTLAGDMPVKGGVMLVMKDNQTCQDVTGIDGVATGEEVCVADGDDIDVIDFGLSGAAGPVTYGFGVHDVAANDDPLIGFNLGFNMGGAAVILLVEDDGTNTPFAVTGKMGPVAVQYAENDKDGAMADDAITLGYTHKLSDNTKFQFTVQDQDSKSDTKVVARLRTDF